MFILSALHYGYSEFIDLLMEKDKKYTDNDVIIKMIMFGILLFLCFLIMYYIPSIALAIMSIGK